MVLELSFMTFFIFFVLVQLVDVEENFPNFHSDWNWFYILSAAAEMYFRLAANVVAANTQFSHLHSFRQADFIIQFNTIPRTEWKINQYKMRHFRKLLSDCMLLKLHTNVRIILLILRCLFNSIVNIIVILSFLRFQFHDPVHVLVQSIYCKSRDK